MEFRFVLTRCGDDLYSIAASSPRDAQAIAARLRQAGDWLEVVPGIDSVLVRFDAACAQDVRQQIEAALDADVSMPAPAKSCLEIPVYYGGEHGPDLDEVCARTGLSVKEFIELHTGRDYTVDLIGFTPGFAFVGGLDERLSVPRRKEPRQRVEAGSVGIADGRTGLYAMASPGGWSVIGRTPTRLFDAMAEQPFALQAGMSVRFKAILPEDSNE